MCTFWGVERSQRKSGVQGKSGHQRVQTVSLLISLVTELLFTKAKAFSHKTSPTLKTAYTVSIISPVFTEKNLGLVETERFSQSFITRKFWC